MRKEDMICASCVKFDYPDGSPPDEPSNWEDKRCIHSPVPLRIPNPGCHCCAQGKWYVWSDKYAEHEPYYWGEWDCV